MRLTVVGIGADGWAGLGETSRRALAVAPLILGAERQLALLPAEVTGEPRAWPLPMQAAVDEVAAVEVLPHPSSFALACARLGWPQADVELVSLVARPPEVVVRALQSGRRFVTLVTGTDGAARMARVLTERGFGASALTVLEQLGGPAERRADTTAAQATELTFDPLHVVAVTVAGARSHPRTPGLPDNAFASDGQLTKRHVRAITVAALGPRPGELLWDGGAGNGSIAIEWLRAEPSARAIAVEAREDRAARITENAMALGVPELRVVTGSAPEALTALPAPDVLFIGGGITTPGLLDACWEALAAGGRVVANTATLEGEHAVVAAQRSRGGALARIDIAHAAPVGAFTGRRAKMTVVQWSVTKQP